MIRKSFTTIMLLVLVGLVFMPQAQAQIGTDNLLCPSVPNEVGWVEIQVPNPAQADFTAGLVGTVENFGGAAVGGLDWMHNNDFFDFGFFFFFGANPTPTTDSGSQLVTWWTQANGRNTSVQVTNSSVFVGGPVHVRILDANCVEIRNFCDFYTPGDTHVYDLGNLVDNGGAAIPDDNLQGKEGIFLVTAVDGCPNPDNAVEADFLTGQTVIVDPNDYMYGVNMYARQAFCDEAGERNVITNGSFQSGSFFLTAGPIILPVWFVTQGSSSAVIDPTGISPNVAAPPASPPDPANDFYAYVASTPNVTGTYSGGSFGTLATTNLFNSFAPESSTTILESLPFTTTASNTLTFDFSILSPSNDPANDCDAALAVILIDTSVPVMIGAQCYFDPVQAVNGGAPSSINRITSGGATVGTVGCQAIPTDDTVYTITPFTFFGGRSSFNNDAIGIPSAGTYAIQVVSMQDEDCPNELEQDSGILADNFRVIEPIICDGVLDGVNSFLDVVDPTILSGQFNVQTGSAGGDAVVISFIDDYGPPYRALAAATDLAVGIWDDLETFTSCGDTPVCFLRLGIDEAVVASEDFIIIPTLGPTLPPTTPPTLGPTLPPTNPPSKKSSGSCAIAASPVELGSGLANVLIPLVPVAFVFGVRALRRKKK